MLYVFLHTAHQAQSPRRPPRGRRCDRSDVARRMSDLTSFGVQENKEPLTVPKRHFILNLVSHRDFTLPTIVPGRTKLVRTPDYLHCYGDGYSYATINRSLVLSLYFRVHIRRVKLHSVTSGILLPHSCSNLSKKRKKERRIKSTVSFSVFALNRSGRATQNPKKQRSKKEANANALSN